MDVDSFDTDLVKAEANWETTPKAMDKESSSDFEEMSCTGVNSVMLLIGMKP